jgi:hypothetical protein
MSTLTVEQRAELLMGDDERAVRNLPKLGWADASCAPAWAQARILEVRSAIVESRPIPAPSREFIAGAEQRSAALAFASRLFPTRRNEEDLRVKAARLGEQIRQDAVRYASCVRAVFENGKCVRFEPDHEAMQRRADEEAEQIRQMRREIFPWETE